MNDTSEQQDEQTPEELAATLAGYLDETLTGDMRRRLEPGPAFSAEFAWSSAQTETAP